MGTSSIDHAYTAVRIDRTIDVSYERFMVGLEAQLGVMNLDVLREIATRSAEDARAMLAALVGPSGFALFQKIDHGALLTAFRGERTRAMTVVFGNALIAIEMTRHERGVGLYVPLRVLVEEVAPLCVRVTYDKPSATLAQFGSPAVDAIARSLDAKVEQLLEEAAKQGA